MKIVLIIVVVLVVLGAGYYALSPLFNTVEVNDELPEEITSGFEDLTPEKQAEMLEIMEEVNKEEPALMEDTAPTPTEEPRLVDAQATIFPVMGTLGHPASGFVRVIETAEGTVLRYEDFETINGPRLHVYLSKDLEGNDFIDLGPIKGTKGNINYTVPDGVDLSEYRYVMYWCVPFRVLFNYAEIGI